jgi:lipid-A-disaccharide synthase
LAAIAQADAAFVSSGTAVLECALAGVPVVVLYVVAPQLEKYAQRVRAGRFIALPNLVMQRRVVPEFLQEQATPEHLADEMERVLRDPARQYGEFLALREALGPPDAIDRCAAFAVELAKGATH